MGFIEAVNATPDIQNCYRTGLTAFGGYSKKIEVRDPDEIQGSVDIDQCTCEKYPNENRWDYAFAYKDEVYFVEVHSANTSEVRTVLRKLQWLKDWLNEHAPELNRIKVRNKPAYYWIQSKGFAIPKHTPQYLAASNAGIKPISRLILN